MDCKTARGLIEPYRGRDLDEGTEALLVEHLGACKRCRKVLSGLDVVDRRLRSAMTAVLPSAGFAGRVEAALSRAPQANPVEVVRLVWLKPALLAASVLAVAFAGWMAPRVYQAVSQRRVEAEHGIGRPFVVSEKGRTCYSGDTGIEVARVVRGAPELVVEVFPE